MFVPPPPQLVARLTTHQGLGRLLLYSIEYWHTHVNTYDYMKTFRILQTSKQ